MEYFDREAKKRREQEQNLWSEPGDPSHSERDDDRILYNLIQNRNQTRRGSLVPEGGPREGDRGHLLYDNREFGFLKRGNNPLGTHWLNQRGIDVELTSVTNGRWTK